MPASGTISPFPKHVFLDNNGAIAVGYKLFVYLAGTTTKTTTWTDAAMSSANTNPIVMDAAGRCTIFVLPGSSLKFVFALPTDTDPPAAPLWTIDQVSAVPPSSTAADVDVSAVAGEGLTAGDAVAMSDGSRGLTAGRWYKTDADFLDVSTGAQTVGFAVSSVATGGATTVRTSGRITGLSGLVAGTSYYISATAGALTTSAPTNARIIAIADSSTTAVIVPGGVLATATLPGLVSTGVQTIAGAKTFTGAATFTAGFSAAPIGAAYISRVTSQFDKTTDTTLADVTGLSFPIAASEEWTFKAAIFGVSPTAGDWKMAVTAPAGVTAIRAGITGHAGSTLVSSASGSGGVLQQDGSGNEELIILEGYVRNGSTAGTIQVQMAQIAASGTNSIRVDSNIVALRKA